jgi:ABC-type transport system involved in cytochrome c biogenesis permease component
VVVAGSFVDWSGILLFVLPTRGLCVRWIGAAQLSRVAAGLFLGTWMISGVTHVCQSAISYSLFHWPEKVWITLIPIIPGENLARSLIGAVIGTGVISGLRAIGLLRPREAIY